MAAGNLPAPQLGWMVGYVNGSGQTLPGVVVRVRANDEAADAPRVTLLAFREGRETLFTARDVGYDPSGQLPDSWHVLPADPFA